MTCPTTHCLARGELPARKCSRSRTTGTPEHGPCRSSPTHLHLGRNLGSAEPSVPDPRRHPVTTRTETWERPPVSHYNDRDPSRFSDWLRGRPVNEERTCPAFATPVSGPAASGRPAYFPGSTALGADADRCFTRRRDPDGARAALLTATRREPRSRSFDSKSRRTGTEYGRHQLHCGTGRKTWTAPAPATGDADKGAPTTARAHVRDRCCAQSTPRDLRKHRRAAWPGRMRWVDHQAALGISNCIGPGPCHRVARRARTHGARNLGRPRPETISSATRRARREAEPEAEAVGKPWSSRAS